MNIMPAKPAIVLICGASGVGKSEFDKLLIQELKFDFSVSATTRALRPGEIDGVHYHQLSMEEFIYHAFEGHFIEYAGVHHGDLYGTFREPLNCVMARNGQILLEIDVVGRKRLIANACPAMREAIFSVIIMAPNAMERERRLRRRNDGVSEAKILQRLARAEF